MSEPYLSLISAFLLGVITIIQPCPLSMNFSIISLITGAPYESSKFYTAVSGFITGYVLAFVVLAFVIAQSIAAIAPISLFLQSAFSAFSGPVLILIGMILSRLIDLNRFHKTISLTEKIWLLNGTFFPSLLLGGLLALSFCPTTASLFFGMLLPLSIRNEAGILFPVIYALGALVPLVVLSFLVRRGLTTILPRLWTKSIPQIIGWLVIALGVYITLRELYL